MPTTPIKYVRTSSRGHSTTYLVASLEDDADGNATNWAATSVLYVNGVPVEIAGGQDTPTADFGPVAMADTYYASTSSTSVNASS